MSITLEFDYYRGEEADQYSFYRIPKALFTNARLRELSADAKILYGLMLDCIGLSARNGWLDAAGRVYIYFTLEDAIDMMGFGHNKVVRLFRELEAIGLIERKKQGQSRPAVIYVKNFVLPRETGETSETRRERRSRGNGENRMRRMEEYREQIREHILYVLECMDKTAPQIGNSLLPVRETRKCQYLYLNISATMLAPRESYMVAFTVKHPSAQATENCPSCFSTIRRMATMPYP